MKHTDRQGASNSGVALLTALGLLFLFSTLGAAYVTWMTLEVTKTDLELQSARARNIARGGVQAAIGEIEASLAAKRDVPKELKPDFPVLGLRFGTPLGVGPLENIKASAVITIHEETPAGAPNEGRQFRIMSQGIVTPVTQHETHRFAEAVVAFGQGAPQTVYWTETPENKQ